MLRVEVRRSFNHKVLQSPWSWRWLWRLHPCAYTLDPRKYSFLLVSWIGWQELGPCSGSAGISNFSPFSSVRKEGDLFHHSKAHTVVITFSLIQRSACATEKRGIEVLHSLNIQAPNSSWLSGVDHMISIFWYTDLEHDVCTSQCRIPEEIHFY